MADSSLDEFFAKKDKSKKGKSKYTTTDTIAKKLEESGKKVETLTTPKKEKNNSVTSNTQTTLSIPLLEQDSDDWKDIEEEKEKDYSGLKVQALSISEKEKEEEQLKEQQAEENGESSKFSEGQFGPWKMANAGSVSDKIDIIEEEVKIETKAPSAYVPPHLRYSSSVSSSGPKRSQKSAPEISSELHFPSLAASADTPKGAPKTSMQDKSFQSVKHGVKSRGEISPQGPQLDLENKFAALHQRDN